MALLQAVLIALCADPHDILRPTDDPYAPWVIAIAKLKMAVLPWYWGKS